MSRLNMQPTPKLTNKEYLFQALEDQREFDETLKRKAYRGVGLAGGSLTDSQIGQTKFIRPCRVQGTTWREMIASDLYVADNMKFGIARNNANAFSISVVNQGNAILITKLALMSRDNLQLATFREIISKGFVTITPASDSANPPIDNRPIQDFLCSMGQQVGVPALAAAAATTVAATTIDTELSAGMASFGAKFDDLPDLAQPIMLKNGQAATLVISGLAGTAAGSAPLWGVVPVLDCLEFVGLQS